MERPQIVLDTNVLVAGLRSNRGSAFQVLRLVGRDRFDINISVPIILEYEDVLLRQVEELGLSESDIHAVIDYYCQVGRPHQIYYLWRPSLKDPNDEMLLELAVKAQCDYIVTFNIRDFQGIKEQFGIVVLTPNAFLREIGVR